MSIQEQRLLIGDRYYDKTNLEELLKLSLPMAKELYSFMKEWMSDDRYVRVQTSGSTGTPKQLRVEKSRMMESARRTCSFLQLSKGDAALLCLPLAYIAGKMMVVRALVGQLRLVLVTPSGSPLEGIDEPIDFAAMIPLQVYNALQDSVNCERLQQIKQLIIGGGAIDAVLEEQLYLFPRAVWSTYGMTETLSHIALRRLNGDEATAFYRPMKDVTLLQAADGSLIIDAPAIVKQRLFTNDLVLLNEDQSFQILGRKDTVINTGGVKVQMELVEQKLQQLLCMPFQVTAVQHPKFGELVVLLLRASLSQKQMDELSKISSAVLTRYECPKRLYEVDALPITENGKPDRLAAKKLATILFQSEEEQQSN
ncbi:MAG: AMP-binding protein [Bacteroidaceae bacterium]|nr:AMP-binding protein [Bacteroidaceae bacterium]